MAGMDARWLHALYDRFNRGDRAALIEHAAPDFVVRDRTLPEFGEEIRGLNAYIDYLKHLDASFTGLRYEVESVQKVDDRVVARVRASVIPAGTDIALTGTMGHVWTLKDGKAARLDIFPTWAETLAAVGLPE